MTPHEPFIDIREPWPAMVRWGAAMVGVGALTAAVMVTHAVEGGSLDPEVTRQLTTLYVAMIVIGSLMIVGAIVLREVRASREEAYVVREEIHDLRAEWLARYLQISRALRILLDRDHADAAEWEAALAKMREEVDADIAHALVEGLHVDDGNVVGIDRGRRRHI